MFSFCQTGTSSRSTTTILVSNRTGASDLLLGHGRRTLVRITAMKGRQTELRSAATREIGRAWTNLIRR